MAKENNIENTEAEQQRRAKEEEEKLEKEKIQLQKERDKRKKKREAKKRKLEKKEQKRIKWLINLPFMSLFKISSLITFLAFIFIYFWLKNDIYTSILMSFFIFTAIYLGFGIIMVAVFYLLSIDKEQELKEELRLAKQKELDEEKARQDQEMSELEALERELAEKRLKDDIPPAELPGNSEESQKEVDLEDVQSLSEENKDPEIPDFDDLESNNEPKMNKETENTPDETPQEENEPQAPELPSRENTDESYLEDIFGDDYKEEKENV
jgi:Flp pilus assembly protein TadB